MEVELSPEPDPADPALRAALVAVEQSGLADDVPPPGSVSAWRQAGVLAAVDRDVTPRQRGTALEAQALPARSTRGATRA
jgi:hypothetical protein